jgi:hypothetical protein
VVIHSREDGAPVAVCHSTEIAQHIVEVHNEWDKQAQKRKEELKEQEKLKHIEWT